MSDKPEELNDTLAEAMRYRNMTEEEQAAYNKGCTPAPRKSYGSTHMPKPPLDEMLEVWATAERAKAQKQRRRDACCAAIGIVLVAVVIIIALGLAGGSDAGLF